MTEEVEAQEKPLFTVQLHFKSGKTVLLYNLTKWERTGGNMVWAFHEEHEGPIIFAPMFELNEVEFCLYEVQKELVKF